MITCKRLLAILVSMAMPLIELMAQSSICYTFNKCCKIELPAKLELQSSELNDVKFSNISGGKGQVTINTYSNRIVFQQKGLNDNLKTAYDKYCRVILEYYTEDRNNPTYRSGEQILINKDIIYDVTKAAKESCLQSGTPLLKMLSLNSSSINGFPVLYYSYKRQGWEGKQPPVIVNVFRIFNCYESVTLTFSYRERERDLWKDIHHNIKKTFSFIRKY